MNRKNSFSKSRLIYSFILNTAVLLLALLVFKPFFEEIDDTHISMILEGAFGAKETHTIFTNTLLGYFVVFLEAIIPNVRWFIVLQYIFIYWGYIVSVYAVSKHKRGRFLSLFLVISTFYEMYVSVQYTKTATFVCIAGFVAFFEYVREKSTKDRTQKYTVIESDSSLKRERVFFLISGWVLIIYGILLRKDGIFLAMVSAAALGIIEILRNKRIKPYIMVFVPVGITFLLLQLINNYTYSSNDEWKNIMSYNTARTVLNDQRCERLDYSTYGEELKSIGVSENDALVLLTYQFGDDDVLSYDRLKEIGDSFPNKKIEYKTFANLYENLINELLESKILAAACIGVLIIFIASIIIDRSKSSPDYIRDARLKLLAAVIMAVLCMAAFVYFQYKGRYSHRLFASVAIPLIITISYMIDGVKLKENESKIVFGGNFTDITLVLTAIVSTIIVALNVVTWTKNQSDYTVWKVEYEPKIEAIDEMLSDDGTYYVADTFTVQNLYKFSLFTVYPEGYFDNFITCGSWYLNTPITKNTISKYGYTNPYDALRHVDDNVYLIDNLCVNNKTTFLSEHYDGQYDAELVETKGGFDIYKIKLVEE